MKTILEKTLETCLFVQDLEKIINSRLTEFETKYGKEYLIKVFGTSHIPSAFELCFTHDETDPEISWVDDSPDTKYGNFPVKCIDIHEWRKFLTEHKEQHKYYKKKFIKSKKDKIKREIADKQKEIESLKLKIREVEWK
jgi:hypothetical protein